MIRFIAEATCLVFNAEAELERCAHFENFPLYSLLSVYQSIFKEFQSQEHPFKECGWRRLNISGREKRSKVKLVDQWIHVGILRMVLRGGSWRGIGTWGLWEKSWIVASYKGGRR